VIKMILFLRMDKNLEAKSIGYFLERTTRIVKLAYLKGLKEAGLDITPEQWVILSSLYEQNGQSQTELASESFKNAPTISRILDLLCDKGYTERRATDSDRRKFLIFLTDQGKKAVRKAEAVVDELRQKGWENLTDRDYENFLRIINQVFQNFED